MSTKFKVVRGTEERIQEYQYVDGQVYFAIDSGRMYLDVKGERVPVGGGNGVVIHYGLIPEDLEPEALNTYSITSDMFENKQTTPQVGDLILNSDGRFLRITDFDGEIYQCVVISVSGAGGGSSGGGGTGIGQAMQLRLTRETPSSTVLNGQSVPVTIEATSAKDPDGVELDQEIYLTYTISTYENNQVGTQYRQGALNDLISGSSMSYDFGPELRPDVTSIIIVSALSNSVEKPKIARMIITSSNLELTNAANFSNLNVFYSNEKVTLMCNAIGNMNKILEFSFDGKVIYTDYIGVEGTQERQYSIPANSELLTHGVHTVKYELFQDVNPNVHEKGLSVDPIEVEIAVVEKTGVNSTKPVIWFGDYQNEYKTYDDIQIPFKVYNNGSTEATVYFYKNNQKTSERNIKIGSQFEIYEIADAMENATNYYAISCGEQENEVRRDIVFSVVEDKEHIMVNPQEASLKLSFDAKGRSNDESSVQRVKWVDPYCEKEGIFEGFNWYNNGWVMDNYKTCLRISNGAKFRIPFGPMTFNGGAATNTSNSFDFQFKIRNVKDYSSLIKTVTRYVDDEVFYNNWKENYQKQYPSYDSFLTVHLAKDGGQLNDNGVKVSYDDLVYLRTDKLISLDNVVCGFFDGDSSSVKGLCIGPQDAFFSNGTNTVSADFVDDQMIYLTFVYDGTKKNADGVLTPMMFIYLNGVLTGVVRTTLSGKFTIGDGIEDKAIEFNSEVCDIDLYKVRFYNTALSVNDVVMNYAIDNKDITTYDQNGLAEYIQNIQEYRLNYKNVLAYNKSHPNKPLMPYVIFDTSKSNNNDRLSFSKKYKVNIGMEFVNTPLDLAFQNGELEDLAIEELYGGVSAGLTAEQKAEAVKKYYLHHCPSFITENSQMAVQGTSSEFYPRRNYKIKTKTKLDDDKVERVHFWLTSGPYAADFAEHGTKRDVEKDIKDADGNIITPKYTNPCHTDWFYMNNYTNGTTKFTMKVDYMESSGSYNMGLANLVFNAYSKHPLEDYVKAPAPDGTNGLFTNISELNSELGSLRWSDYRTSVQGFPVMAFHKKSNGDIQFIGLYRMLLDKGSDECYGFKPSKKVTHKLFPNGVDKNGAPVYKKLRDVAECWEFSDNNRGFCSFRDPWNREELSFRAPDDAENKYTANLAPIVADSFEYRYSKYDDALDVIYEIGPNGKFNALPVTKDASGNYTDSRTATLKDAFGDDFDVTNLEAIHEGLYKAYRNYEKACAWVWLTNTENVISGGTYQEISLGNTLYESNKYYVATETGYEISKGAYDPNQTYFIKSTTATGDVYEEISLVDAEHLYSAKKFYIQSTLDDTYVLADGDFDSAEIYYVFTALDSAAIEEKIANGTALHTKKLTDRYTEEKYPGYLTEDGYAKWDTSKKYLYDTQEFRSEKFTNELALHFDIEYLATYFIITEVLECYDSRGKNCMMASWGPQSEGGDYIWYPIFYDMDTQLGINNTGIPSFAYNVDVTEEGNFSTSDSILWNNFYKNYKSTYILDKYKHLKGENIPGWGTLSNPVFNSVSKIEKWYEADPIECKNISMRGDRPLIAKNLDEYYKYITITNNIGLADDLTSGIDNSTGYQSSGTEGEWTFDDNGTYFYALQGDRSLSRQQFLTNRFEYIDSWLNQGNYQRGGQNRIRGRVSANYKNNDTGTWYTSDHWMYSDASEYWVDGKEFTTKTHDFDSQYWLTLQPVRNTYVTIGGDANSTYPSQKYSGTPVNYAIQEMKDAVVKSNLAEKLLYVYGMNQMADAGDLYKNYWTEFYLEGKADKLSSLLLGCDGVMYTPDGEIFTSDEGDTLVKFETGADGKRRLVRANSSDSDALKAHRWYNNKINLPTMPSSGLPLLEEANFSNLFINVTDPTLKMDKSEKLQVFRATGSNFTQIDFAPGVSLHTLYLPSSITRINLAQAKLLTNIITDYAFPQKVDGKYVAEKGLYVEGLTDWKEGNVQTKVSYLNIEGDAMGFDSYKLLKLFYNARKQTTSDSQISITEVQWTPYRRLVEGDVFDAETLTAGRYYLEDGHYGYTQVPSDYNSALHFDNDIANGVLYELDESFNEDDYLIKDIDMFDKLIQSSYFIGTDGSNKVPNITGDMYVHNATGIDEVRIRNYFNTNYPKLNITFKTVNKSNSMKFIVPDLDDDNQYLGTYSYVPLRNGTQEKSVQKRSNLVFDNPYTTYNPNEAKANYDFIAWSSSLDVNDTESYIGGASLTDEENAEAWQAYLNKIQEAANTATEAGQDPEIDYTIYALFTKHKYEVSFWNGTNQITSVQVLYGECLEGNMPDLMPIHPEEDKLDVYKAYKFLGFSRNDKNMVVTKESDAQLVDYSMLFSVTDYRFYAVYIEVDVHNSPSDLSLFNFVKSSYTDAKDSSYNIANGYIISPKRSTISGKVTLPLTYQGSSDSSPLPIIGIQGFGNSEVTHVFWNDAKGDNPNLRKILSSAFQNTPIQFFEFTSGLRVVEQSAFMARNMIKDERCVALLGESPLLSVGQNAFNSAFGFTNLETFKLRGTIQEIGPYGFMFQNGVNNTIGTLQIGSQEEPSVLKDCGGWMPNTLGGLEAYEGIRPSNPAYTSYFTNCIIYKKAGVFNDEIFGNNEDLTPLIAGYGSLNIFSV